MPGWLATARPAGVAAARGRRTTVFLLVALIWMPAMAASTDYDGKWRLDGTCTASTVWPWTPAITFWAHITIQNGSFSDIKDYVSDGIKSQDSWTGRIQDSTISLVDEGHNDTSARWLRNLNGRVVSSSEIAFQGDFFQWITFQWVHSRTCSGKLSMAEAASVSLAGREATHGRPAPAPPPPVVAAQRPPSAEVVLTPPPAMTIPGMVAPHPTPEVRVALVVGNAAYANRDNVLRNPTNDAHAVAAVLREIGFDVVEGDDLNWVAFNQLLHDFFRRAANARVALLFYSGHGMQVDGKNYLIPVDAKLADRSDLSFETVDIDKLLDQLSSPRRTNIILLDACRDNPMARTFARQSSSLTRSAAVTSGLAGYSSIGAGTLIAYATAPGRTAVDGTGSNSPFTISLVRHLRDPNIEIRQVLTKIRAEVASATDGTQIPWDNSSLMDNVYLVRY